MVESPAELHSAIISSDVMRKGGDARGADGGADAVLKRSGTEAEPKRDKCGRAGNGVIRVQCEIVKWRGMYRENRASVQRQLDDATQDQHKQDGRNYQIHRVSHSSPHASVSVLLS
ncbi:hypothetical protein PQQ53_09665 [Paraburkholderia strydomiana]|jgi:predicted Fe-S protein YdhL (DUF1289 family)|uniref:hypothetical protein n=1 Tax=Paraburkholderia strydomiana TaxID=1245417 RepID=UPI0038BCAE9F